MRTASSFAGLNWSGRDTNQSPLSIAKDKREPKQISPYRAQLLVVKRLNSSPSYVFVIKWYYLSQQMYYSYNSIMTNC
jgi:hypothetical protein